MSDGIRLSDGNDALDKCHCFPNTGDTVEQELHSIHTNYFEVNDPVKCHIIFSSLKFMLNLLTDCLLLLQRKISE